MPRSTKKIVSEIQQILREAVQPHELIEKGDFVHYQHPSQGEWHVNEIDGAHATITDPDGQEKFVPLSTLSIAQKKLTDADFHDMPMTNSLQEFFNLTDKPTLSEGAQYHIDNNIPLSENVYRYGSKGYGELWAEFRKLHESKQVTLTNDLDIWLMENTELGLKAEFEGKLVPLDMPMVEPISEAEYKGRDVKLNKPKRGGSKKFYVYVRSKKGNVKKVSFGAKSGGQSLAVKIKDKDARKRFADRHSCSTKKDKTKAGYWSCNLPRYAKTLGLGDNMNTYW